MKKKLAVVGMIVMLMVVGLIGCSAQERARSLGGSYTIELPANQKLVSITWKENDLWYLTRPMTEEEVAETYQFKEDSTYGIMEGTVTIVESKTE